MTAKLVEQIGDLGSAGLEKALANVGVDVECGACMGIFFTGVALERHTCKTIPVRPVPMIMYCPACAHRHIDEGEFAEDGGRVHHTHACQYCGTVWRPAIVPTVGVHFLPGFKNGDGG